MSSEMVACIAVESLSILEKMHAKGFVIELFVFLFVFNFCLRFLISVLSLGTSKFLYFLSIKSLTGHGLLPFQLCAWRC